MLHRDFVGAALHACVYDGKFSMGCFEIGNEHEAATPIQVIYRFSG